MRKFFATLFVVLIATAIHAKLYNFAGIQATDIVTAGTIGTYTMDGVEIPSVTAAAGTDINCTIYGMDDMVINYSNSSGKTNILKFAADYMQADGKNVILTFSNVTIGDEIVLLVSAKGSTPAFFEALSGCEADANNLAVDKKDYLSDYVQVKFYATATTVQIKETSGGFRIITATVGESSAQEVGGTCGDNLTWTLNLDNGALVVSGYGDMYNCLSAVDFPWYQYASSITNVTLPSELTNIGNFAFFGCSSLSSITIPEGVTSIGYSAFNSCSSLTSVILPESVTSVVNYAFYNCSSLSSIAIPEGVTSISDYTFYKCSALESVVIPEGTTSIGKAAFADCSSLGAVVIPNSVTSVGDYAFNGCASLSSVTLGINLSSMGDYVFFNCGQLAELNILATTPPAITTYTFDYAHASSMTINLPEGSREAYMNDANWKLLLDGEISGTCGDNLTWSLNMSEGVLTISGYGAMYDYNGSGDVPWNNYRGYITAISIPDGMTNMGDYAFWNCYNLTSLTIGQNVSDIGNYALYACFALTEINVATGNSAFSSENGILYNTDKTTLIQYPIGKTEGTYTIPSNVNRIGNTAFSYSPNLASIVIPGSVTNIGVEAFSYCSALNSVSIQEGVMTIDYAAFAECSSLQSISIPNSVETIGDYALYNCNNLYSVTIGGGVTTIGEYAFASCTSLVELNVLPVTPPSIYSNTFDSELNSSFAITVPEGSLEDYRSYANWRRLLEWSAGEVSGVCGDNLTWILNKENGTLTISGYGAMYDYAFSSEVPWNDYRSYITSVSMPEGMTSIGNHVFEQLSLSSVSIPTSVTSIGAWAFRGSNINSITIPENVASIGDQAFYECYSLTSIDVDERSGYYSSENGVLFNKDKTQLIRYPVAKSDVVYSIPNSVTALYSYAFSDCHSLNAMVIPENVTTIGDYAFAWCGALQSVTIGSSVTTIGEYAFASCSSLVELNVLPVTPPSIYSNTFDSELNSSFAITVPEGSLEDYRSDANWRRLLDIAAGEVSGVCGDNLVWTLNLDEGTLTISGTGAMYDYTYDEEVPWYDYHSYITNVSMPAGMTSIGNYAFYNCYNLASVTIGSSVTSIGEYAFNGCGSLVELDVLPITPPSIYSNTFDSELNSSFAITVPEESLEDYRSDANWRRLLDIAAGEVSGVCGDNLVWTLNMDEGTLTISGYGAMYEYAYPDENPWYGYRSYITSVSMPDEMTGIGNYAFYNCYNLASVTIGSSVTSIGEYAFSDCYSLNAMVIPDNVTSIGNYAFAWCDALLSATIGNGVTTIGNYAFFECNNLASVTIGSSVTSIGEYAFSDCYSLNAMVIPDNVTSIGNYAFAWCGALQSATIGSGVTSIGEYAFGSCGSLVDLNVLAVVPPSIYSNTFDSELNPSFAIAVPEGSQEDYRSDENWRRLLEWSAGEASGVCGDNLVWTLNLTEGTLTISGSGAMYDYTYAEENPWYGYRSYITNVSMPDEMTSIGNYAFYNCYNLSSLTIGSSVTSIGEYAFSDCYSLNAVVIPDNVTNIDNYAFAWCSNLQSVTIGSGVTSIGESAFRYCGSLVELNVQAVVPPSIYSNTFDSELNSSFAITVPEGSLEDYRNDENWRRLLEWAAGEVSGVCGDNLVWTLNLDEGTLTISGYGAMYEYTYAEELPWYNYHAYIINVSMPAEMTSIGNYAFYNCYNLSSVTIGSGVISIGEYAFGSCGSLVDLSVLAVVPPSIYSNTFDSELNPSFAVVVPEGSLEDYRSDENWRRLLEIASGETSGICGDNLTWTLNMEDGTLVISGYGAMYEYNSSEEVPWYDYRSYITNVSISEGMTSISSWSFRGSSIVTITIPANVINIGSQAFYECYSLSSINVDEGNYYYSSEDGVLFNKEKTVIIRYPVAKSFDSYIIPNSVTTIYDYAFSDCSTLVSVTIPEGVIGIGDYAFAWCYNLNSITCLAMLPPSVNNNFVSIDPTNCMLYVHQAAIEDYQSDPVWSLFMLERIETENPIEIYQLMLNVGENGAVLYDGTIFTSEHGTILLELQEGTTPTIQILPNQGYGISSIMIGEQNLIGQTDEDGYITLPAIMENTTCTVLFDEVRYKVEYYFVGSHGSFYTTVAYGSSFTCRFAAHEGNVIGTITLNGMDVTDWMENDNSITIDNITEDMILILSTNDYNTNVQSVEQSRLRAWQSGNTIFTEVDETVKAVMLYDISGRLMREYYHNGDYQVLTFPAPNQVNLLKVVGKDGTIATHKLM